MEERLSGAGVREAATVRSHFDGLPASVTHVLLDFDGPVCSLFAGHPAVGVARSMRSMLDRRGLLPMTVADDAVLPFRDDPHGLLSALGGLLEDQGLARPKVSEAQRWAHEFLAEQELVAAETASPTPYAVELITGLVASGVRVAVVSNNSADAVLAYLGRVLGPAEGDSQSVIPANRVFGRPERPELMKPDPYLLHQAMDAMGAASGGCVMLGDSASDFLAAEAAEVGFIGVHGSDPERRDQLRVAGVPAGRLLGSLAPLVTGLKAGVSR